MNINQVGAEIGQWYKGAGNSELFRVVGFDERSNTIEMQYFAGDLDELDVDSWSSLRPRRCSAPEDGRGPIDDVETDNEYEVGTSALSDRDALAFI